MASKAVQELANNVAGIMEDMAKGAVDAPCQPQFEEREQLSTALVKLIERIVYERAVGVPR